MAVEPTWGTYPQYVRAFTAQQNIVDAAIPGNIPGFTKNQSTAAWTVKKGVLSVYESFGPFTSFLTRNSTTATDTRVVVTSVVGLPVGISAECRETGTKRFNARLDNDGVVRINSSNGSSIYTGSAGAFAIDRTSAYSLDLRVWGVNPDITVRCIITKVTGGTVVFDNTYTTAVTIDAAAPNSGGYGYGTSASRYAKYTKLEVWTPSELTSLTAGFATLKSSDGSTVTAEASPASGGTGLITYQWKYDSNSSFDPAVAGTNVSGQTTLSLTATGVTGTQYFKLLATDSLGATVAYSGLASTAFIAPLVAGLASRASVTSTTVNVSAENNVTGGVAPYFVQWHRHTVSTFDPIADPTTYALAGATTYDWADTTCQRDVLYFYKCVITDSAGTKVLCDSNVDSVENIVVMGGLDRLTPSTTMNPSAANVPAMHNVIGSSTLFRTYVMTDGHNENIPTNMGHVLTASKGSTVAFTNKAQSGQGIQDFYGAGSQVAGCLTAFGASGSTTLFAIIGSNNIGDSLATTSGHVDAFCAYWLSTGGATRILLGTIGVRTDAGSAGIDKIVGINALWAAKAAANPSQITLIESGLLVYQANRVGGASNTLDPVDYIHQTATGSDAASKILSQAFASYYSLLWFRRGRTRNRRGF